MRPVPRAGGPVVVTLLVIRHLFHYHCPHPAPCPPPYSYGSHGHSRRNPSSDSQTQFLRLLVNSLVLARAFTLLFDPFPSHQSHCHAHSLGDSHSEYEHLIHWADR